MTYNNSTSNNKSIGRHYTGNHNLGPNQFQSNNNNHPHHQHHHNPIPNHNAMAAAMMNPSMALINSYAMSGQLQGQPSHRHHQQAPPPPQLSYISFPYPSANDSIRQPYFHAQSGHTVCNIFILVNHNSLLLLL